MLGSIPSGTVQHGEIIEYSVFVKIPDEVCTVIDMDVRFWLPGDADIDPGDICGSAGGITLATGISLVRGESRTFTSTDDAALAYTVAHADEVANVITAYSCAAGTQLTGRPPAFTTAEQNLPQTVRRGACCDPCDGSCVDDQGQMECKAAGGIYQGDGSTCALVECPPLGACCDPCSGECAENVTAEECARSPHDECTIDSCDPFLGCSSILGDGKEADRWKQGTDEKEAT